LHCSFSSLEKLPEPVEALVQHLPVHVDPVLHVFEAPRPEAAATLPPDLFGRYELSVLEHANVLLQRR
jgi:hypothetical protein